MSEQLTTEVLADSRGIGLIELIVYSMLLVIISVIAGSLLITALTSQRDITAMSSATSRGQVLAASIENGVRTASTITVPATSSIGQRLVTRTGRFTAAGVGTWLCRSWLIAPTGKVYYRSSTAAIPAPSSLSATDLAGWSLLTEGVKTAPGATSAFSLSGSTLSVAVEVAGTHGAPALIKNRISKQTLPTTTGTGPSSC